MIETQDQIDGLRHLYRDVPAYRPFFDALAEYGKNMRTIKVDVLHKKVGGKRSNVVQAFRAVSELELGNYIKGTWGHPSRFDFISGTSPKRIGLLAKGVDELPSEEDLGIDLDEDFEEDDEAFDQAEVLTLREASIEDLIKELKARGAESVQLHF